MATIYRMYNSDDIDALVQFWSDNSEWDQIDRKEWERRFYNLPYGPSSVVIAEDKETGEIRGQIIFIPTIVAINGYSKKALRPFAFVIKKSPSSITGYLKLAEIAGGMYKYAITHFRKNNISLIHMMPDPRWARLLKLIPDTQLGSFPLYSLPLSPLNKFLVDKDYSTESLSTTDSRINLLWEISRKFKGCMVARDTTYLPWKISHGRYILTGIKKGEELIGLVVSIPKLKDKQWLICDILASDVDQSLKITIQSSCNLALDHLQNASVQSLDKVSILATPAIEKVISSLGFKKDNYQFPILVHLLDPSLTKNQVAPENWYVSAND